MKVSRKEDNDNIDDNNEPVERFKTEQISSDQDILLKLKTDLQRLKTDQVTNPTSDEPINLDLESFDQSVEEPEIIVEKPELKEAKPEVKIENVEPEITGELPEVRSDDQDDGIDFFQSNCGRLGGSAVLQAFGRAAHNLLTGKGSFS